MGYKLHRGHTSMFRRRSPVPRILLSILGAVAVIVGGFFFAKWLDATKDNKPPVSGVDSSAALTPDSSVPSGQDTNPDTNTPAPVVDTVRGFYLPHAALTDGEALAATLKKAASAGYNTLLFDLKDADGTLYYAFTGKQAEKVNSFAKNALDEEGLKAVIAAAKAEGIQVVPRLFAFKDNAAARALADARITPQGNPGWVWYDGDPKNGGKAWLNPYADEAHLYILTLAQQLKQAGVAGVMLDGVQFPAQTYSADYGSSSNATLSQAKILATFVDKMQAELGADFPVLLGCTGRAALGKDTGIYGGNPITYGADLATPNIRLDKMPSSVTIGESKIQITPDKPEASMEAIIHHMVLRLKVSEGDTTLCPWLDTEDLSGTTVQAMIKGCEAGECAAHILYHPDGEYPFSK